ncbi:nicotinate-nucleotide adenylyltransferase [Simiduia sp. 21SJ11W-1]|uniref:nicotinate-nucleotide adenylyltransferase n=1 Tax=Simiduia sp. 21SJ11W-1 TaxID=2909669 RepID=UPI0020A21E92|nr:nicotinate-nucleotide adenylyltransferase [Simiduia sp. 21SJ11W-1]UTA48694.1 nicotinate-nucleotide adenylyltransferase [Simiduia sp. 21SJ11W-1]
MQRLGVLGGTFDPIHLGHLAHAEAVRQQLALDEMRLMPAHIPPHRASPQVDARVRAELVRLALADYPELTLDTRELDRATPSYTVDSLAALREELGPDAGLYFVMGMDSLCALNRWHQWRRLTTLANLVVVARPGACAPGPGTAVGDWLLQVQCDQQAILARHAGGVWLMAEALVPISATQVRAALQAGKPVDQWLSAPVVDYIRAHNLYAARPE